jgi:hypothetical protein
MNTKKIRRKTLFGGSDEVDYSGIINIMSRRFVYIVFKSHVSCVESAKLNRLNFNDSNIEDREKKVGETSGSEKTLWSTTKQGRANYIVFVSCSQLFRKKYAPFKYRLDNIFYYKPSMTMII